MIVGLRGVVVHKEPAFVHVDVSGIVYEVFISLQSFSAIGNDKVKLFTSHVIREDAQLLYGFLEIGEKKLFERLIKINGVGPKVAMAICSTYTPEQFALIINNKDINGVKKVPGIGPKNAGRILVELSGFDAELILSSEPKNLAFTQAGEALESLGFKKEKISKALSSCSGSDTASLVKEALKLLQTI
ncbi:MAG: Holliday junction DNA helicase RuvA [Sulfurimonas sp. RIFOXYD12_FULL_33_39]|uniref:Holliday junction branch migration protein RuvA n=1 Tax=unclassified Sulfurimonas TaxID=2623549 RepID=UPI0008D32523|nr:MULTISPECIES: Holliday junction branch migration protein RuvA [unclassified Sulfurimonas]OHE03777.1 MAG: Holliday junction DNA helicase RuvA [Sulfurimonas sp. RIFCSPLOWO2_12_FULL_34_6]OHE09488.1 MAG: Holliday junction DNA helicase RuvA [Sulfurimonas sp. RIFOXYD12_FULL_33_39]OHE12731.1 MAG: Holliday junction DNA helicase RuvA [Sulfurimonas sp. RIFOXYD2_FULL_34_21]DAB28581.1 MAG TPA: Holliday junction branch migration protein RuvA [Sulfurimonas sp. UBA10385]